MKQILIILLVGGCLVGQAIPVSTLPSTFDAPASANRHRTINVKTAYGARGNGTTDDARAINKAIAALKNGETLYFPCGTYKISSQLTAITNSYVTVRGEPSCTTIKTASAITMWQIGKPLLSPIAALSGPAPERSKTFSAHFAAIGGLRPGDYILLSQGGADYSTDSGKGHPAHCDISGCRNDVLQIQGVTGDSATVTTFLHDSFDPNVNNAWVQKIGNVVRGVTIENLTLDGSGIANNGLLLQGVVDSTVSGLVATGFTDVGLGDYYGYNNTWKSNTVMHAGSSVSEAYELKKSGHTIINGLRLDDLNNPAFGLAVYSTTDSTLTNITVDYGGVSSGRPVKLLASRYNTFNSLTLKNTSRANQNGVSLEYYSSHNTFNNLDIQKGPGSAAIAGFGNFNQYNTFNNCTVGGGAHWQLGQMSSALGNYQDTHWAVNGGTWTAHPGQNIMQVNGAYFYIHGATFNGPQNGSGNTSLNIDKSADHACINKNIFNGSMRYAIYIDGPQSKANGNTFNGAGRIYPDPLPTGDCH